MSDPKPSKPAREELRDAQRERNILIGSHPPRFELHFHVPRYPNIDRPAWYALVTECTGLVMSHLAAYGMERVEIYGDGIKVFVVVPNDPNITLRFFDGAQEEIQRQILLRGAQRAKGVLSAQDALDRLTEFVVEHVEGPYGSLDSNADRVEAIIGLLRERAGARRVLARWDEFDLQVRALQVMARQREPDAFPRWNAALHSQADEIDRVRQGIGGQP